MFRKVIRLFWSSFVTKDYKKESHPAPVPPGVVVSIEMDLLAYYVERIINIIQKTQAVVVSYEEFYKTRPHKSGYSTYSEDYYPVLEKEVLEGKSVCVKIIRIPHCDENRQNEAYDLDPVGSYVVLEPKWLKIVKE